MPADAGHYPDSGANINIDVGRLRDALMTAFQHGWNSRGWFDAQDGRAYSSEAGLECAAAVEGVMEKLGVPV